MVLHLKTAPYRVPGVLWQPFYLTSPSLIAIEFATATQLRKGLTSGVGLFQGALLTLAASPPPTLQGTSWDSCARFGSHWVRFLDINWDGIEPLKRYRYSSSADAGLESSVIETICSASFHRIAKNQQPHLLQDILSLSYCQLAIQLRILQPRVSF
jgi:hypothetical protein